MKKPIVSAIAVALALGSGLAAAGPALAQPYPPPPPPPREGPPPPPPPGRPMAWEPGHYQWLPGERRYIWIAGHYVGRRPGGEFIPGHWGPRGAWIPAHWR